MSSLRFSLALLLVAAAAQLVSSACTVASEGQTPKPGGLPHPFLQEHETIHFVVNGKKMSESLDLRNCPYSNDPPVGFVVEACDDVNDQEDEIRIASTKSFPPQYILSVTRPWVGAGSPPARVTVVTYCFVPL